MAEIDELFDCQIEFLAHFSLHFNIQFVIDVHNLFSRRIEPKYILLTGIGKKWSRDHMEL